MPLLNPFEVLETLHMIQAEKLDIRTITMGISLRDCADHDGATARRRIYGKITRCADRLVAVADEIQQELDGEVFQPGEKVIPDMERLRSIVDMARVNKQKIVFTNGCFDIFHFGHVSYLSKARGFGDILIVGLNSDSSIRRIKGEKRPVIGEKDRVYLLASLACIDYVILFGEDTPERLIGAIKPDVLVKGSDWSIDEVVGREIVEARGGRVELVKLEEGISTSQIIERIIKLYGGNG
jgi:rfaE bifunctional protein nucleotidyltransferase chain/domain